MLNRIGKFTTNDTNLTNIYFGIKQRVRVVRVVRGLLFIFIFLLAANAFGQQSQPWWLTLEQGKLKFRGGDYGAALLLFEDARRARQDMYEQMERDFIHLLSEREARRIGDALDIIENFARDRYYTSAVKALEELYFRIPKNSLNNSAQKALEAIGHLRYYPEAEFWIGEVYRIEGEHQLALNQYRKAINFLNTVIVDNKVNQLRVRDINDPGLTLTLQYKIAEVLFFQPDYNEMIRTYMSIIEGSDTLWNNSNRNNNSSSFATDAMMRTLDNDGIGRFLELYRYNNLKVENAHRQLGFHYSATGVPGSAKRHLMYAFLIQNTVILEEIIRKEFDFTLEDPNPPRRPAASARELMLIGSKIDSNPVLKDFAEEVEYYKTAYYLALSLYRDRKISSALIIWQFLANQASAGEWHARAVQQLRNPQDEPLLVIRN